MDFETFRQTVEGMTSDERQVAILFYMKDIKDLLQSICEAKGVELKHY